MSNETSQAQLSNPAHEHRKKSAKDLLTEIKKATKNEKIHELVDLVAARFQATCENVAMYCNEIPRGIQSDNEALRYVFEQLAESIRDIPDSPHTAAIRACNARMDAMRIPVLSEETRRAGYEEGYRSALKKSNNFVDELDINID